MIGYISTLPDGTDSDFDIFLAKEEIKHLNNATLEGVLFRGSPIRSYTVYINIIGNPNIGVDIGNMGGVYHIFISRSNYEELKEKGWYGTRTIRSGDFKIDFIEESVAEQHPEYQRMLGRLKHFQKN